MIDELLRRELIEMRAEDLRVRQELLNAGELDGPYVPRMEAVHVANAARMHEILAERGWPAEDVAGKDGAEAAWLIVQHAIGDPKLQRESLVHLQACATAGRVPAWQAAYLEDRIALFEGRPQRYGTQWLDDPVDGRGRPWTLAEPHRVSELRKSVGLEPLQPIPAPGPELSAAERCAKEDNERWWQQWLAGKGWTL